MEPEQSGSSSPGSLGVTPGRPLSLCSKSCVMSGPVRTPGADAGESIILSLHFKIYAGSPNGTSVKRQWAACGSKGPMGGLRNESPRQLAADAAGDLGGFRIGVRGPPTIGRSYTQSGSFGRIPEAKSLAI
jgi:hypothetical protein